MKTKETSHSEKVRKAAMLSLDEKIDQLREIIRAKKKVPAH